MNKIDDNRNRSRKALNYNIYVAGLIFLFKKFYHQRAFVVLSHIVVFSLTVKHFASDVSTEVFCFYNGQMSSKLQKRIGNLIRVQFAPYRIRENIRPRWLESPDGERLELDFYIPQLRIAFEIQGEQHYKFVPHFHRNSEGYAAQLKRDIYKKEICIEKGVELIEIASDTDYDLCQDRIATILDILGKTDLHEYLIRKVSQEIISTAHLKINLAEATSKLNKSIHPSNRKSLRKKIKKLIWRIEVSAEIVRYLSIIGIQEFHNLRKPRLKGYSRWIEWRAEKKQMMENGTHKRLCTRQWI